MEANSCEVKTPFCHHTFLLYVFASSFPPAKKHNLLPSSLQICAHTHTLTAPTLTPTPCQRRLQIDCFRMSLGRRETKLSVLLFPLRRPTVGHINQEYRLKYRAIRSSICSFARTAHSFACSALLALLARSAALTRTLARSLHSIPRLWDSE